MVGILSLPSCDYLDAIPRSIVGLTIELDFVGETTPHRHRKGQLLYVIDGLIIVEAAQGIWTVPPRCAIWIPGGVSHFGRATGRVSIRSLYIDAEKAENLRDECAIVFVQPLLRELILRLTSQPAFYPDEVGRETRLAPVVLDELRAAPLEPLRLPMPSDRRLRRLVETMLAEPSTRLTIEEWGARIGASIRTLTRLFHRETGMPFGRWRQQLHIGLALQKLAVGEPVLNIAIDLGYESPSAFIAMFRRALGTTPARYFSDAAMGQQPPRRVVTSFTSAEIADFARRPESESNVVRLAQPHSSSSTR